MRPGGGGKLHRVSEQHWLSRASFFVPAKFPARRPASRRAVGSEAGLSQHGAVASLKADATAQNARRFLTRECCHSRFCARELRPPPKRDDFARRSDFWHKLLQRRASRRTLWVQRRCCPPRSPPRCSSRPSYWSRSPARSRSRNWRLRSLRFAALAPPSRRVSLGSHAHGGAQSCGERAHNRHRGCSRAATRCSCACACCLRRRVSRGARRTRTPPASARAAPAQSARAAPAVAAATALMRARRRLRPRARGGVGALHAAAGDADPVPPPGPPRAAPPRLPRAPPAGAAARQDGTSQRLRCCCVLAPLWRWRVRGRRRFIRRAAEARRGGGW